MGVLLVTGDDDLLLQREVERRIEALQAEDPQLTVDRYDIAELAHLPELRTASLFGGGAVVVLRGVEAATGDLKSEVEDYLAKPAEEATLVLVARGTGRIQRIAKAAAEVGERVDVKRPPDYDTRRWDRLVGEEFRRLGRKADATAVAAIRTHAGTDPAAIASQVGSVAAAHLGVAVLTAEHVDEVVQGTGKASGFDVADAVAARDPQAALVALRGALDAGDAPLALLGAVAWRLRQLLQVRSGSSAREAGIRSEGQYRHLVDHAARFHPGELAWCHDRLARLDVDLKGAQLPDTVLLELGILEVATSTRVGAPWDLRAAG